MDLRIDSNGFKHHVDESAFHAESATSENTEAPTLGSKAMQCLSKLGKYIVANPKTVLMGVALVALGIAATAGWGLVAVLGAAFGKLLIGVGVALIGLPISWEFTKDIFQLDAPSTDEEIAKQKEAQLSAKINALKIALALQLATIDRMKTEETCEVDLDVERAREFLHKRNITQEDIDHLSDATTIELGS